MQHRALDETVWRARVLVALGTTQILAGLEHVSNDSGRIMAIVGGLLFGHLADRYGRKRALLGALALHAAGAELAPGLVAAAVGGELCTAFAAVVELAPVRQRGLFTLALAGSFWLGGTLRAFADPHGVYAICTFALVYGWLPESARGHDDPAPMREHVFLCVALLVGPAASYGAIWPSFAATLSLFYAVRPEHAGPYVSLLALSCFLGPIALGHFFDTWGRKPMLVLSYALCGLLMAVIGLALQQRLLSAVTQTCLCSAACFLSSAAAGAAYLTVAELSPRALRARAIALGHALSITIAAAMGSTSYARRQLLFDYALAAGALLGAAYVAKRVGAATAPPLSAADKTA